MEPLTAESEGKNVPMEFPEGDRSLIQVDMSSLQPENTGCEVMSLYKYLVNLERSKRVTQYDVSYSEITRKQGPGQDGFEVSQKNGHMYKTMADLTKALTCKTFFHDSAKVIKDSLGLQAMFRFRFDRIHACSKVQKPYVFSAVAIQLSANKPVQV